MEEEKIKPFFFCKFVTRARIRAERAGIYSVFGGIFTCGMLLI